MIESSAPIAICAYCNGPIGHGEPIVAWQEVNQISGITSFHTAHRFRITCEHVREDEERFCKELGIEV
jgi:hypothetical protein